MSDLNINFEERQQLAEQMGIHQSDVDSETIMGYAEEQRELGHGAEAARVIAYLGQADQQLYAEGEADTEEQLWQSLSRHLGLPHEQAEPPRYFGDGPTDQEADEDELYRAFAAAVGIPDNEPEDRRFEEEEDQ